MSDAPMQSLSYLERKQFEELKLANCLDAKRKKDRIVMLGLFAVTLLATLLISGVM